jgi:hypothetical protein
MGGELSGPVESEEVTLGVRCLDHANDCDSEARWRGSQPGHDRQPRRVDRKSIRKLGPAEDLRSCYAGRAVIQEIPGRVVPVPR